MADEKIYTVPLRKGFMKAPNYDRTRKAVVVLKEFLKRHTKKDVKIGRYLNLELWKKGRRNPPGKIKVRIDGEGDNLVAELINAPLEKKVEEKKEDTISIKKPKIFSGKKEEKKIETEQVPESIKDEEKEETKKAITDIPEKKKEIEESGIIEKEHAHRKQEEVITERTGKAKSRIS